MGWGCHTTTRAVHTQGEALVRQCIGIKGLGQLALRYTVQHPNSTRFRHTRGGTAAGAMWCGQQFAVQRTRACSSAVLQGRAEADLDNEAATPGYRFIVRSRRAHRLYAAHMQQPRNPAQIVHDRNSSARPALFSATVVNYRMGMPAVHNDIST